MKKFALCVMATLLSLTFIPLSLSAAPRTAPSSTANTNPVSPADAAKANELLLRLNEIKTSDKSELTASEKKDMRKEVRSINSELKAISGGVYISAGVLLIILILLIVLL